MPTSRTALPLSGQACRGEFHTVVRPRPHRSGCLVHGSEALLIRPGGSRGGAEGSTGDFIVITLGFLVQWPTLATLVMFPILVSMYVRLARPEEQDGRAPFGERYARYAALTPAFPPRLSRLLRQAPSAPTQGASP
jgi:hypothetical protein